MKPDACSHLAADAGASPKQERCEACGAEWSLRVCGTCGYVGCCEASGGHAARHAHQTGHPIIRSLPLTEHSFVWCYACDDYLR